MENRLRVELLITVCALLLTGIASIASVYQAHMIARQFSSTEQQFSATVWPYLTITNQSNTDDHPIFDHQRRTRSRDHSIGRH